MVVNWLIDGMAKEPWAITKVWYRHLPPTIDEDDIVVYVETWAGCMLNDTTNMLVKDDSSREKLQPLLLIA